MCLFTGSRTHRSIYTTALGHDSTSPSRRRGLDKPCSVGHIDPEEELLGASRTNQTQPIWLVGTRTNPHRPAMITVEHRVQPQVRADGQIGPRPPKEHEI